METITPFSNGTEAMNWYFDNCEQCVKAYLPKDGEYPSDKTMKKYVSCGRECKLKYAIDWAFVTSEIPVDIAKQIGYIDGMPQQCMMFSDDDNDRFKWPKRPGPEPDNQMVMPFIIEEIERNTIKTKIKQL